MEIRETPSSPFAFLGSCPYLREVQDLSGSCFNRQGDNLEISERDVDAGVLHHRSFLVF
jgi:hypothetical protein